MRKEKQPETRIVYHPSPCEFTEQIGKEYCVVENYVNPDAMVFDTKQHIVKEGGLLEYLPLNLIPWPENYMPMRCEFKPLYDDIRNFVYDHNDLIDERQYDIISLWIMASWLTEHWNSVPYLKLLGPKNCLSDDTKIMHIDNGKVSKSTLRELAGRGSVITFSYYNGNLVPSTSIILDSGVKDIYRITLDDGRIIDSTSEHTHLLQNGMEIKTKDISTNTYLQSIGLRHEYIGGGQTEAKRSYALLRYTQEFGSNKSWNANFKQIQCKSTTRRDTAKKKGNEKTWFQPIRVSEASCEGVFGEKKFKSRIYMQSIRGVETVLLGSSKQRKAIEISKSWEIQESGDATKRRMAQIIWPEDIKCFEPTRESCQEIGSYEGILQIISREASQQNTSEKQDNWLREDYFRTVERAWNRMFNGRAIKTARNYTVPRLSYITKLCNRGRWSLLAQRSGEGEQTRYNSRNQWIQGSAYRLQEHTNPETRQERGVKTLDIEFLGARVKSVEYLGKRRTYDLQTPSFNNFLLANGMLTHNSGKTRVMDSLRLLCYRGCKSSDVSESALYRVVEQFHITVLLDESEIYASSAKDGVQGLLNAGYRRGDYVIRVKDPKTNELSFFDTFGFKALAGTEALRDTLESRCISIIMSKNVRKVKFRMDEVGARELRARLLYWRFYILAKLRNYVAPHNDSCEELSFCDGRYAELFHPLIKTAKYIVGDMS